MDSGMLIEAQAKNDSNGQVVPEGLAPQAESGHGTHAHPHLEPNGHTHTHTQTGSASPPVRQDTISSISTLATIASNVSTAQALDSPLTPTYDHQAHLNGQVTFRASPSASDGASKKKGARRRTGPLSEEQRHKAALMRRIGACDTCKAKRVGCDPSHRNTTFADIERRYPADGRRSESPPRTVTTHYRERDRLPQERRFTHSSLHLRDGEASPGASNVESEFMDADVAAAHHFRRPSGGETRVNRTPLPSGPRLDARTSPLNPLVDSPLQGIASRIVADPGRGRYNQVHVLTLYWEADDDSSVKTSVEQLAGVLSGNYNYTLYTKAIPPESGNKSSWTWLSDALNDFMRLNDQPDVLKVVYYNGYSYLDGNRQMVLASSKNADAQSARWSGLQQILEEACLDTLLLMDAPYYPLSALTRKQGVFELIAAASGADHATQIGRHTFTRALTDLMSRRVGQPGDYTSSDLHAQLLSSAYPRMLGGDEQQLMASFPCPLHLRLSGNAQLPSISLAPVHGPATQNSVAMNGVETEVTFRITADNVNMDAWAEWLRLMPMGVKGVEVAGPYRLGPKT